MGLPQLTYTELTNAVGNSTPGAAGSPFKMKPLDLPLTSEHPRVYESMQSSCAHSKQKIGDYGGPGGRAMRRCLCAMRQCLCAMHQCRCAMCQCRCAVRQCRCAVRQCRCDVHSRITSGTSPVRRPATPILEYSWPCTRVPTSRSRETRV